MKKLFFSNINTVFALMTCALAFSCAKPEMDKSEDVLGDSQERVPVMTLSTQIESEKTEISAEGKVLWANGDALAVFAGGKAYKFELLNGAGSVNAVFACYDNNISGKTLDGVAAYPYHKDLKYNAAAGTVEVYNPHTYAAGSTPAPMVGVAHLDNSTRYAFRNLDGIFRFTYTNVPTEARTLQFTATSDITGIFTVNALSGRLSTTNTSVALGSSSTKVVTVTLPEVRPDGTVVIDVPVPTGAYKGFSIALCDAAGNEIQGTRKAPSATITAYQRQISPISAIKLPQGLKLEWVWDNNGTLPAFVGQVPAIDGAGNVYVAANENKLHKLDKTGKLLWSFNLSGASGRMNGSPCLEDDGSVCYIASGLEGGVIYAVNASGSQKWKFSTPYSSWTGKFFFDRAIVGVGKGNNIYVPVNARHDANKTTNDFCGLWTIKKSDGTMVSYASGHSGTPSYDPNVASGVNDGTCALSTTAGSVAISSDETVSVQTNRGSFTMKQSKLDSPTYTHATYGKHTLFGYQDLWPHGWGLFDNEGSTIRGSISQGVICGYKGKTSGKNMVVSCAQESANLRMDIYASDISKIKDLELMRQYKDDNTLYNDPYWCAFWLKQYGTSAAFATNPQSPARQDQGGIIMGHNDLEVLVPFKYSETSTGTDDKGRPLKYAGIQTVWVDRYADPSHNAETGKIQGVTSSWRFNVAPTEAPEVHSVEAFAEVSGAPAIDNNAWVHVATHNCYHIFSPGFQDPYPIVSIERVNWEDLLVAHGIMKRGQYYTNAWTSVKLGDDGKIYINLCLEDINDPGNLAKTRGIVLCMSYPGVTGTDPSSSWPQKGADARNSCNQYTDASKWTDNRGDAIPWD